MTRTLLPLLLLAAPAVAQVPYAYPSPYGPIAGPQSFAPNYYNRGNQPLSPYLNLGNTFNPAAAYYYGVRPGTQGPNGLGPVYGSGAQQPPVARGGFLPPPVSAASDPTVFTDNSPRAALPSPGGAVSYGNFNGSSRVGVGGRGGFFGGGGGGGGTTAPRPAQQPPSTIPKSK